MSARFFVLRRCRTARQKGTKPHGKAFLRCMGSANYSTRRKTKSRYKSKAFGKASHKRTPQRAAQINSDGPAPHGAGLFPRNQFSVRFFSIFWGDLLLHEPRHQYER